MRYNAQVASALAEVRHTVLSYFESFEAQGKSLLYEHCWFATIAVGDDDIVEHQENRDEFATYFAALKRMDPFLYSLVVAQYFSSYIRHWGIRDGTQVVVPRGFIAYPGRVLPPEDIPEQYREHR